MCCLLLDLGKGSGGFSSFGSRGCVAVAISATTAVSALREIKLREGGGQTYTINTHGLYVISRHGQSAVAVAVVGY